MDLMLRIILLQLVNSYYQIFLLGTQSFYMERHQATTSFDSPMRNLPNSEKQIQANYSKTKNVINSTHRRTNQCSQKIIERVKKMSHTHKNSTLRKNKSKCQTQAHQSTKKRNGDNPSLSKKTLKRRKNLKLQVDLNKKLKLSLSKNQQQSLTLKSSGKRNWPKKQLFHSTCFSRHMEHENDIQSVVHLSSDFVCPYEFVTHKGEHNSLKNILERTKMVLNSYQNRCEQLRQSCNYYMNQLSMANKTIEELTRKRSMNKNQKKDCKDSIRSTFAGK